MTKYRAQRTEVDGVLFASKRESARYLQLKMLEKAGRIAGLELQPKFPITIKGVKVCTVVLDFAYWDHGKKIYEDVKGVDNPMSRLKRKLVSALYGIDVEIVR